MEYVIGVDGGGTKTAFALADRTGKILASAVLPSISYREHGFPAVASRLREGAGEVAKACGIPLDSVKVVAVGAPGYGENPAGDRELLRTVSETFPEQGTVVVNDAQIACYGALSGRPGINVVAGTGSIAYGEDEMGNSARSGGWSEHFSDEGSCYWLGKMAMSLFCKESDGREPKGALYEILRKELSLGTDVDFIQVVERDYLPYRSRVAGLQKFLLRAAKQGDRAAVALYGLACQELCQLASGVRSQLRFSQPVSVSITGGLTHAGALVEEPLSRMLERQGMVYCPCEGSPLEGAVRLACRKLGE